MKRLLLIVAFFLAGAGFSEQIPCDRMQQELDVVRGESPGVSEEIFRQYRAIVDEFATEKSYKSVYDKSTRLGQTYDVQSCIKEQDGDPLDVLLRRARALSEDLSLKGELTDSLAEIEKQAGVVPLEDFRSRFGLFVRAMAVRRRMAFSNPLLDFDKLLFVKRDWAKYFHMCDQFYGFNAQQSGGLFVVDNPFSDSPQLRDILKDAICTNGRFKGTALPKGGYLSPDLSYDGKRILFAFTEGVNKHVKTNVFRDDGNNEFLNYPAWTEQSCFHVFSVNVDGTGLTQLTDGAWNDFDPCWMPNGRIVFVSERRGGYLRCSGSRPCPNYTLHTMNDDGSDIVCISPHELHEWNPSIDDSGMVLYTRWDYIDRGFNQAHHPWITTPDGRDPRALHGNYAASQSDRPNMSLGLRSIPGSHKIAGTAAAHHAQHFGSLIMIDPRVADDNKMAQVKRLTPDTPFPECEAGTDKKIMRYGTAYPLSEKYYLCAYMPDDQRHGIYLVDCFGNRELIYRDPAVSCIDPIPLRARPMPPVVPHISMLGRPENDPVQAGSSAHNAGMATMGLLNVYNSRYPFPDGVKIKALRIMRVVLKTTPVHHSPQIGYGCETSARAVLGTVPVEDDGSAFFKVPAGVAVFFQALDEDGMAVQSMRSETYAQPGEVLVCNGCHEERHQAPQARLNFTQAMKRGPSDIEPEPDGSNPLSFPRLVQPVLESRCVECHEKNKEKKAPDLQKGNFEEDRFKWYTSYRNLEKHAFYFGARNQTSYDGWQSAETIPGQFGARVSKLYQMLKKGHHDLKLEPQEMHRITLWLDSNSDFFGSCDNIDEQSRGKIVIPNEKVFVFDHQEQ